MGSSNEAKTEGQATPPNEGTSPADRQTRRYRRASSEEVFHLPDNGMSYPQYPPTQISYNPQLPPGAGSPTQQGHHRVRSWSGSQPNPFSYGYPQYPPSPSVIQPHLAPPYSPSSSPYVPPPPGRDQNLNGPTLTPPNQGRYDSSRRKRKGSGHQRVHSYSGGPSYGTVSATLSPGPPPPVPPGRSQEFSPRSELMKLTGSFQSSPRNSMTSSLRGIPASPRQSFSPAPPVHAGDRDMGDYGMYGEAPKVPLTTTMPVTGGPSSMGGEAVFLAQNRNKSGSRKMHMREKSAQIFMEDVKGVQQLPACRDIIFLMLFVFHILGIVYLGNTYGHESLVDDADDDVDSDSSITIVYRNIIYVSCLSGAFAIAVSALALLLMTAIAKRIVQVALVVTITLSFAWGTMGIGLSPKKVVPATGIIALALSVAYTVVVWDRCKFHGANLSAGLTCIRENPGAVLVAFFFQFLALGWSIYFTYVVVGVYDATVVGEIELSRRGLNCIFAALAVSYYWTLHVFLNIVQVTVAGVIGSWWYTADGDTSTRGADLKRAFFRSSFYSIGSICLGSLLVGPARFLGQMSALFRPSEEVSSLSCLHQCVHCAQSCVTSGIDGLTDRFNPWAFTYVGLYGYNLVDAGLHSTELFEKRGWTTIVSDDLVPNVLLMTSLVIGGLTGCFAHLIGNTEVLSLNSSNEPVVTSFVVGALVGFVVSSVLFGIISSSVNAVIVCFAASPVDFHNNHQQLSAEMRSAWREVWPGACDVVDMRLAVAAYLDPAMDSGREEQPLLA